MYAFRQTTLPNTEIRNSISNIYGLGYLKACLITTKLGYPNPYPINKLNSYQITKLFFLIGKYVWLDIRIKRIITTRIFTLIDINSYKGLRHADNLPCRGQRTRTNGRTAKKKIRKKF